MYCFDVVLFIAWTRMFNKAFFVYISSFFCKLKKSVVLQSRGHCWYNCLLIFMNNLPIFVMNEWPMTFYGTSTMVFLPLNLVENSVVLYTNSRLSFLQFLVITFHECKYLSNNFKEIEVKWIVSDRGQITNFSFGHIAQLLGNISVLCCG